MRTLKEILFGKEIERTELDYAEAIAKARELQEQGANIQRLKIQQFAAKSIDNVNPDYGAALSQISRLAPYDHGDGLKGDTKVQYNCNRFDDYENHRLDFILIFDNLFKKGLKQKGRLDIRLNLTSQGEK